MLAVAVGWKLMGISVVALVVSAVAGVATFDRPAPSVGLVRFRRAAGALAVLALGTLVVIAIVGPGPWCESGDAYHVPGCA